MDTSNNITSKQFDNAVIIPQFVRMIDEGHSVTFKLRGFSMRPFLEDGRDKVVLGKPQSVKCGDAVLAEIAPRRFVLHRIVAINGQHVTLRGDGNIATEHCSLCDIRGIALAFYRKNHTKPDSTTGLKWRIYSFVWTHLLPIRRYLLFIDRKLFKRRPRSHEA